MKTVPWKTILVHAPTLVEAARKFYGTTRETEARPRPPSGLEALRRAVEDLEHRETQQAALFSDLARQVEAMATAVEVLRARMVFALVGTSVATVLGIIALIVAARR